MYIYNSNIYIRSSSHREYRSRIDRSRSENNTTKEKNKEESRSHERTCKEKTHRKAYNTNRSYEKLTKEKNRMQNSFVHIYREINQTNVCIIRLIYTG
jgi:hypothetical protein